MYIDGYVLPIPTANKDRYRTMAATAAAVFKEHGAISVMECWGDDVNHGKLTDFYRAVQCSPEETPVFSWVLWPSKAARDAGHQKVFADPRLSQAAMQAAGFGDVFDGRRMIMGGFAPLTLD
jgi:uncharacterized protein YbaA (DUF1428 family)